ncbi:MAG: DMT family transporter [Desulfobacterales bacterium]|nr:DMT family transporter [Desulfobacterales bacterium]
MPETDFSALLFPAFASATIYLIIFKIIYSGRRSDAFFSALSPKMVFIHVLGAIFFGGSIILYYWGLQEGPKVVTNLLNYLWPVILFILARYLLSANGNKTGTGIFLFIIAFVCVLFLSNNHDMTGNKLALKLGPCLGLIAAILWASFCIYLKKTKNQSHLTAYIFYSALLTALIWVLKGRPEISKSIWISIVLGIFPFGIAMQCWEVAIRENFVQKIASLSFLIPLLSTLWLFLGGIEPFKIGYLPGGIFIVTSVYFFQTKTG